MDSNISSTTALPNELLFYMAADNHEGVGFDFPTVVSCAQVCKDWRELFTGNSLCKPWYALQHQAEGCNHCTKEEKGVVSKHCWALIKVKEKDPDAPFFFKRVRDSLEQGWLAFKASYNILFNVQEGTKINLKSRLDTLEKSKYNVFDKTVQRNFKSVIAQMFAVQQLDKRIPSILRTLLTKAEFGSNHQLPGLWSTSSVSAISFFLKNNPDKEDVCTIFGLSPLLFHNPNYPDWVQLLILTADRDESLHGDDAIPPELFWSNYPKDPKSPQPFPYDWHVDTFCQLLAVHKAKGKLNEAEFDKYLDRLEFSGERPKIPPLRYLAVWTWVQDRKAKTNRS